MKHLAHFIQILFLQSTLLLLVSGAVAAQGSREDIYYQKEFINISVENGLPNNLINSIAQDSIGYLWVGTADGLCRYGGNEFMVFRNDRANPHSISSNYINDLSYDAINNHFLVATDRGLDVFDLATLSFQKALQPITQGHGSCVRICEIPESGERLILMLDGLLVKISENDSVPYVLKTKNGKILKSRDLTYIGNNKVLITTWQKVYLYDLKTRSLTFIDSFPDGAVNYFGRVAKETILATRKGLFLYNKSERKFVRTVFKELSDIDIIRVYQDSRGVLWVGTREEGMLMSNEPITHIEEAVSFKAYKQSYDGSSVFGKTINAIFEDSERGMWLGSWSAGLNYLQLDQPKIFLIRHNPIKKNSISHTRVWGLCRDEDILYVGTDGGGLNAYNLKTGENTVYSSNGMPGSISDNAILCALKKSDGSLWFGTYKGGLNRFDPESKLFTSYKANRNNKFSINNNDVRLIFEDSKKRMWIGVIGGGLQILDSNTGKFLDLPFFQNADIRSIVEDRNGGFWIATYGEDFAYYQSDDNDITFFNEEAIPELKSNKISSLALMGDFLWIGTRLTGVIMFNVVDHSYNVFDENDGLINNSVRSIVLDQSNDLWISTNKGVSMIDTKNFAFRSYSSSDGVQQGEFNVGSVLEIYDNWLCFGGTKGLNFFNVEELKEEERGNKVFISQLTIIDKPITQIAQNSSPLFSKEYRLTHEQNVLQFNFETLNFPFSSNHFFYYKLEGSDKQWNIPRRSNSITYANLEPGKYTMKLAQSNIKNEPSEVKTLEIIIVPPIWKTSWAYWIYLSVLLFVLFLILWYYTQQVKLKSSLVYEKKIRSQEHDLNKERIRFFTNFSHELRTPLTLILGPLRKVITKENDQEKADHLELVHRNALKLRNLINKMLDFRKAQSDQMKLRYSEVEIGSIINDILESYKDLAELRQIKIEHQQLKSGVKLFLDVEKLEIIMNNLLSNALKYTDEGGEIIVKTNDLGDFVEVRVIDNAVGISQDSLESIFQWYFQAGESKNVSGTGIGLALTKKLVELHGGEISVESEVGKGSEFIFTIHKPQAQSVEFTEVGAIQLKLEIPLELKNDETFSDLESMDSSNNEKERILVVDDNPDIVQYIKQVLSDEYFVFSAVDGEKGINLALDEIPDLIISDVMMPEKSGIDLCKTLKSDSRTSHIPIILLTARHSVEYTVTGYATGADSYMTKPFEETVLVARVKNLLENRIILQSYFQREGGVIPLTDEERIADARSQKEKEFLTKVEEKILQLVLEGEKEDGVFYLAKELGFSRASLYRKLKTISGYSINEFTRKVKMKKANELLSIGEMNVSDVAFYVGFSDVRYFRNIFKKEFGKLPSEAKNEK
ncbi:MAG: signal transduction histidine kinase/ligand-binding sensor domain-containing protein [Cyclobacteriaceae bacterium]|jgi:signal transduction histidine kinase/ligand-binding sensor domain-containing protein/DNA-binding response OmpR family regulator